jgi:hypothetical protein
MRPSDACICAHDDGEEAGLRRECQVALLDIALVKADIEIFD